MCKVLCNNSYIIQNANMVTLIYEDQTSQLQTENCFCLGCGTADTHGAKINQNWHIVPHYALADAPS